MALPKNIVESRDFQKQIKVKLGKTPMEECQIEVMEGGGFLLQFFVLTGGRIEVALRVGTQQTFNPKSVHKISKDELSTCKTIEELIEKMELDLPQKLSHITVLRTENISNHLLLVWSKMLEYL